MFSYALRLRDTRGLDPRVYWVAVGVDRVDGKPLTDEGPRVRPPAAPAKASRKTKRATKSAGGKAARLARTR